MKDHVQALFYLLNGHDTTVRNLETKTGLMVFDDNARLINEKELQSLEMGETNIAGLSVVGIGFLLDRRRGT